GTGVGLAIVFRTIGYALVLPLLITVVLHALISGFSTLRAFLAAAVPIVALYSASAMSQYVRHGEFGIGSAGGTSLLGKGLVLARRLADTSLPDLNGLADAAVLVRSALRRIDDPALKPLVLRH